MEYPENMSQHISSLRVIVTQKCHSEFTFDRKSRWPPYPTPLPRAAPAHNWISHAALSTPSGDPTNTMLCFIASAIVLGPKLLMTDHTECIKFNRDFKCNISHFTTHLRSLAGRCFMMICFGIEKRVADNSNVALWRKSDIDIEVLIWLTDAEAV